MERFIKSLQVNGLKTFEEGQEFHFSPITLLYGENNTGKTTLLRLFSSMGTVYNFPTRPEHSKVRGLITICGDDGNSVKYHICGDDVLCCQAHKAEIDGEAVAREDIVKIPSMKATYNSYGRFIDGNPYHYDDKFVSEVGDAVKEIMAQEERASIPGDGEEAVYNIVEDIMAVEDNSVVCLHNPEIYLSSRTQERLIEYAVLTAKRKNLQLVIETHSDTIIYAIRVLYKEGVLENKDARVLFFSRENEPKTIMFDKNGTENDLPDGYCDHWTEQLLKLLK